MDLEDSTDRESGGYIVAPFYHSDGETSDDGDDDDSVSSTALDGKPHLTSSGDLFVSPQVSRCGARRERSRERQKRNQRLTFGSRLAANRHARQELERRLSAHHRAARVH